MRGFIWTSMGVTLLTAACLAMPVSGVAADASTAWQVQPSPNVTRTYGQVDAVSCTSSSTCTAVGAYLNSKGVAALLAERWNGTSWHQETLPTPAGMNTTDLQSLSVSCVGTSFCATVGSVYASQFTSQFSFAYTWNGTSWRTQSVPIPAGAGSAALYAVSCVSQTFCEAVGESTTHAGSISSLAERWNGSTLSIQPSPNQPATPTELDGVSCVTAYFCQAVDRFGAMAERWNGTTWTARSVPTPAHTHNRGLYAVSCPATNTCEAVGSYEIPGANKPTLMAERWNGSVWEEQPVPNLTDLQYFTGVSCVSATSCAAVGYDLGTHAPHGFADQWNGTSWVSEPVVNSGGTTATVLTGVSCGGTTCEASAWFPMGMESWNGTSWARQPSVFPPAALANFLTGVSCVSATDCEAVGYALNSISVEEVWNGTTWRIQSRATNLPQLAAVSCPTATFCEAVGTTGSAGTAAATWNGTTWAPQSTPLGSYSTYSSVSCPTTTFCVAVGGSGAMTWNGTSWSKTTLPTASSTYASVSCASATSCEAVGPASKTSGGNAFAAEWNGSTWTAQTVPGPAGATQVQLVAVSCPTASACEAVGESSSGAYSVAWNGTAWTVQGILPVPSGISADVVVGVACTSATDCTMVGLTPGGGQTLAEVWDGTSWAIQTTANPGKANNVFSAVSCTPGGRCTAVGSYLEAGSSYTSTLIESSG